MRRRRLQQNNKLASNNSLSDGSVFQLVLQFAPWGQRPLDDLIALEDQLSAPDALGDSVDGHDIGSGEANIFIITSEPHNALRRALPIVAASTLSSVFAAGVRHLDDDFYKRCWPQGDDRTFIVR